MEDQPWQLDAAELEYPTLRTVLEACRIAGDVERAIRVQALIDGLGLAAKKVVATITVGGELSAHSAGPHGRVLADARALWARVLEGSDYTPQTHAVPFGLTERSGEEGQFRSLQVHAEKKALAELLGAGEERLEIKVDVKMCADCHCFFKGASSLLRRRIP